MPVPGAGEALLRVRRVGICGSDLHIFQGHLNFATHFLVTSRLQESP
jgi:threonine dehydrogenase-like Zn-dependent dehydrogenase